MTAKRGSRPDGWRLRDLANSSERILALCDGDFSNPPDGTDDASLALREALLYNLVIIGEAAGNLSPETTDLAPEINWIRVKGLRNHLTRECHNVDHDTIAAILQHNLPQLIIACARILNGLDA